MTFQEVKVGMVVRDNVTGIVGTVIGKYEGLNHDMLDLQPKSLNEVDRPYNTWAMPSNVVMVD